MVGRTVLQTNIFENLGEKVLNQDIDIGSQKRYFILSHIIRVQISEKVRKAIAR